jgi:hypothetical protein
MDDDSVVKKKTKTQNTRQSRQRKKYRMKYKQEYKRIQREIPEATSPKQHTAKLAPATCTERIILMWVLEGRASGSTDCIHLGYNFGLT